jgi:hypothetical protein
MSMNPDDIFGPASGSGGNFPKVEDLNGKLILLRPSKVEEVPKPARFGGKPGETVTRLTADVTVFPDGDGEPETFDDMYLSQVGIVNAGKRQLKPGGKPFVLGRVARVPSKIGKEQGFTTTEEIEAGLKAHFASNGKKEKPNFSFGLLDPTDEDKAQAMAFIVKNSPALATASE